MKEQIQTAAKELYKVEMSKQRSVIRTLKGPREDLKGTRKIRWETKDTLNEIQSNLQGIHSRADEAEYPMGDSEHGEAKSNRSIGRTGKKEK